MSGRTAPFARSWAEIDLATLRRNIAMLQAISRPSAEPMVVVKADAYGHGAVDVARMCAEQGIRHFGVATVEEGRSLRQRVRIPGEIYLLMPFLPEEATDIVRLDLTPTVSTAWQWEALRLAAVGAPIPAHCVLAIDSGMGREGALPADAADLYRQIAVGGDRASVGVRLVGISTHLARADELGAGDSATLEQVRVFGETVRELEAIRSFTELEDGRGRGGIFLSIANSPGTLRLGVGEEIAGVWRWLNRCGLLTYGIEPFDGAFDTLKSQRLEPILAWRARVTLIRKMAAGAAVGYGGTYRLRRDSWIATLAVGYADGLSRRLSNRGTVLIRGRRYPIVGRVSMDQCQVDVTDGAEEVVVGCVATLIGRDGDANITALDMAETAGTTPHEPTCAISQRVPRVYTGQ